VRFLSLLAWTALAVGVHASHSHADDRDDIRSLMIGTFGQPDARLKVEPVVVVEESAVASWTQGTRGGRALLRRDGGKWRIVLCSGDPLKSASMLAKAGVPKLAAEKLAALLKEAESALPSDQVALFASFEGVMRVDVEQGHGPGTGAHH
jgi:hypothetical protein